MMKPSANKASATKLIVSDGSASLRKTSKTESVATSVTKVRFGSVTVEARAPAKAEVQRNVKSGQSAMERVTTKMLKPGVVLVRDAKVPVYHADPTSPGRLVRELNGVVQLGTFVNGKFKLASK